MMFSTNCNFNTKYYKIKKYNIMWSFPDLMSKYQDTFDKKVARSCPAQVYDFFTAL